MNMNPVSQAVLWNSTGGNAWVDLRELLDGMFRPFETLLADAIVPGQRVLDVGCGTGSTTLAAARRGAACTGIDLSGPMIDAARSTARQLQAAATFICADAQRHAFGAAGFDAIISRFGVMFFDDPVAAFANLRQAARDGASLHCFAWRGADENPYMTAVERAVAPLLPRMPPRQPDAPGQFAFARKERIHDILASSGWRDIDIEPVDAACGYPSALAQQYVARLGPLGQALPSLNDKARQRITAVARAAVEPFIQGDRVLFTAACWQVRARA